MKQGRTGDVVGPPDWFWNALFPCIGLAIASGLFALVAINLAACVALRRERPSPFVHLAARIDAAVWAVFVLGSLISNFGLGRSPSSTTILLLVLSVFVPVHLVAAGAGGARPAPSAPPYGSTFLR